MKGKLSTWLVVGLTAAAFGVGLLSHALLTSGSGGHDQTAGRPGAQAPVLTVEGPAQSPAPPRPAAPVKHTAAAPPSPAQPSSSPDVARTIPVSGKKQPAAVSVPEPNPLASPSPPPTATTAPADVPASPTSPAPPAAGPPPTGATAEASEPVVLEPSARRAMASEAATQLKISAPEGEGGAASKVIQELEQCLQLIADSSLPPGVEPAGCNLGQAARERDIG